MIANLDLSNVTMQNAGCRVPPVSILRPGRDGIQLFPLPQGTTTIKQAYPLQVPTKMNRFLLCLLCLLPFCLAPAAHAEGDQVRIFSNLVVGQDAQVDNLVCIFCDARVEGRVTGDAVVIFGHLSLVGDAQHDLVSIFSSLNTSAQSHIGGDMVAIFSRLFLADGLAIGHDLTTLFCQVHGDENPPLGGERVDQPLWHFLFPFLVIALIVFVIAREYLAYMKRLREKNYPFPNKQ